MKDIVNKKFGLIIMLMALLVFGLGACKKQNVAPGGEGAEGTEGSGSGGEAGNESGILWNIDSTAIEIVNGVKLTLSYDQATETFNGTLENLNTTIAPQVRVEVHVFDSANNSTEYGPTTPTDMNPGATMNVSLPAPGSGNGVKFNMHPEVG